MMKNQISDALLRLWMGLSAAILVAMYLVLVVLTYHHMEEFAMAWGLLMIIHSFAMLITHTNGSVSRYADELFTASANVLVAYTAMMVAIWASPMHLPSRAVWGAIAMFVVLISNLYVIKRGASNEI